MNDGEEHVEVLVDGAGAVGGYFGSRLVEAGPRCKKAFPRSCSLVTLPREFESISGLPETLREVERKSLKTVFLGTRTNRPTPVVNMRQPREPQ
jgi:hypothetical protein